MTTKIQFKEELRQLSAIDQKAGSLLNGNALLFACVSLAKFDEGGLLGTHIDKAVSMLQLTLLMAALMALRAAKMMGKFEKWPLRDTDVSDEEYNGAVSKVAAIVRKRRRAIDLAWSLTMLGVAILILLVLQQLVIT